MVSILVSAPSCPGFNSQHFWIFLEESIVDVSEVSQQRCLEVSEHWVENVDWINLVLASCKQVLQKYFNNDGNDRKI